ncbi:MAG: HNH endonuclease [Acidobacteria bacterium]|nr:HNH endonuclease [Acidobacteriota bacterium]MBI3656642.1 HNH endonuclease [Acidobacteriota bacterium]
MPRTPIPVAIRQLVAHRAHECCEYCRLHQDDADSTHQIDHLMAIKHGGLTASENLALACPLCNRYKGSDLAAIDPVGGMAVPIFNPRTQIWSEHFTFAGAAIIGLTPTGRATVELLRINDAARLIDRQSLMTAGRYPPSHARSS